MDLRVQVGGDAAIWNQHRRIESSLRTTASRLADRSELLAMVRENAALPDGWIALNDPIGNARSATTNARHTVGRVRERARDLPEAARLAGPMHALENRVFRAQVATRDIGIESIGVHFSGGRWRESFVISGADGARSRMNHAANGAWALADDVRTMGQAYKPSYALTGTGKLAIAGGIAAVLAAGVGVGLLVTRGE